MQLQKKTQVGPVFLGISSLENGRIDLDEVKHLSENDFEKWTKRVTPQYEDIVFSYETRLGQVGKIPRNLRCCLGRRLALMRPNREKIEPDFLLYSYLSPKFQNYIKQNLVQGSTVDRILLTEFPNFKMSIPSLNVQRKIIKILSDLDSEIFGLQNQNKILEQIAQLIFKSWFVDFDGVTEFEYSELGKIPKGWSIYTLSNLTSFDLGGTWGKEIPDEDYNFPAFCIRGMNIPEIRSGNDDKVRMLYGKSTIQEKRKLLPFDIVIEISGGSSTQLTGRSLLITTKLLSRFRFSLLPASFCKFIRLKDNKFSYFVYFLLRWIYDVGIINQYETGTTAIKNFQYTIFSNDYKFVLPSSQIIDEFNQIVDSLFNVIDNNIIQLQKLIKIRDILLPKLMSGEIQV